MIDTHCHLALDNFAGEVEAVIGRARDAGLRGMITVSITSENCGRSLQIAEAHDDVWCTAGVHPLYSAEPIDWSAVRAVAEHPKCVAWGELGLDNHYEEPSDAHQRRVLGEQLALVETCRDDGLDKPIVIHCREAYDELISVLRAAPIDPARVVFHCFNSTPEDALKVLDFGGWISFTGIVTFRNAPEVAEAAKLVPLDRMMVETDAPFLTPEPKRKVFPNEPQYVVHTCSFLADLRGVQRGEFEGMMDANAERFFGITLPPAG